MKASIFSKAAMAGAVAAFLPSVSFPADENGAYALRGAGRTTCTDFVAARQSGGAALAVYVGYIDGYLTAFNHREAKTFDIAPWQTTELIAAGLAQLCAEQPEVTFDAVLNRAVEALFDDRLKEKERLVSVRADGRGVFLYESTLQRMRARLSALNLSPGPALFDERTEKAVRLFQTRNGLSPTGLPDQRTLARLFSSAAPADPK